MENQGAKYGTAPFWKKRKICEPYLLPLNLKLLYWEGSIRKSCVGAGMNQSHLGAHLSPDASVNKPNQVSSRCLREQAKSSINENSPYNSSEDQPHPANGHGEHRRCKGWQSG